MILVAASVLVVWANRTLTDTNTYVQTVGPVLEQPALQDAIANKLTEQIMGSVSLKDLAAGLLPPDQVAAAKTPEQLNALQPQMRLVIHDGVVEVLRSPHLQQVWTDTNRTAHAELIRQLDAGAPQVALDLTPLQTAVIDALKQSKLAPVATKLDEGPARPMVVGLAGKPLEQIRRGYRLLQAGTPVVVLLTILCAAVSVWASVHHIKTLRRMLVGTGVGALLAAGVLALPSVVTLPGAGPDTGRLAAALVTALLHGLEMACLWLGCGCLVLALGSKLYERQSRPGSGALKVKKA